jgi:hypothetical protein
MLKAQCYDQAKGQQKAQDPKGVGQVERLDSTLLQLDLLER